MTAPSAPVPADPDADVDPYDGRHETATERLDRNWNELLQELRVLQTGTQILTGFLLTVAFQARFAELTPFQVGLYLVLVSLAALSTVIALTPVALHRGLFRQRAKRELVTWADRLLRTALVVVGTTIVGVAVLLFDVTAGPGWAAGGGIGAALLVAAAWFVLPSTVRHRRADAGGPLV